MSGTGSNVRNGGYGRCDRLPEKLFGAGRLHLWLPLDYTLGKTTTAGGPAIKGHQKHGNTFDACVATTTLTPGDETTASVEGITAPAVQPGRFFRRVPISGPDFLFAGGFAR